MGEEGFFRLRAKANQHNPAADVRLRGGFIRSQGVYPLNMSNATWSSLGYAANAATTTFQDYFNMIAQPPDPQKEDDELIRSLMKAFADRPNKMFYQMGKGKVFRRNHQHNWYELEGGARPLRVSVEVLSRQNVYGSTSTPKDFNFGKRKRAF